MLEVSGFSGPDITVIGSSSSNIAEVVSGPELTVESGMEGPPGANAAQDIQWAPLASPFSSGEKLNSGPLQRPSFYATFKVHSDSGVTGPETLTLNQIRANAVIATATISLTAGQHDWAGAISPAMNADAADVIQLVLPAPTTSASDLSASIGSA